MTNVLAAFDFDHTIVDVNSDVVARDLLKGQAPSFHQSKGWTSYMQEIFNLLQEEGTSEANIRQFHAMCLKKRSYVTTITLCNSKAIINMKEVPGFSKLLDSLVRHNAEVIIISDANEYFIHQWLVAKRVDKKIRKVFTNPARFEGGQLRIQKYHVQNWCKLSTENLCKGFVLENYINERKSEGVNFDKVLYVGDGNNDYCPSVKLRDIDVTFPRKGYAFMQKLDQLGDKAEIKAEIHPWTSHKDILEYVKAHVIH